MSLVVLQFLRQQTLVAHQEVVNERDTCDPVTMFYFSAALQVVLASGEVPHEVAPIHPVELVGEEELDVFPLCRHVHHNHCPALIVGDVFALNVYPGLIFPGVLTAVHAWEKHILCVFVFDTSGDFDVAVLFIGSGFLLTDKFGSVVRDTWFAIAIFYIKGYFGRKCLSVEQRAGSVLFTTQIFTQREDVFG